MTERDVWSKKLKCPICGVEGTAWLSHPDEWADQYEQRTTLEECPRGFQARADEDDSNIFRFFCVADNVAADQ